MTHAQIAARLRGIASRRPTEIWRELHALAMELDGMPGPPPRPIVVDPEPDPVEVTPATIASLADVEIPVGDIEALVKATQPPTRRPGRLRSLVAWRRP